jgi:hypothetical protein
VRSNHAAPIEWFDWEECNRLGSVFFRVVLMVAEGCALLQPAMFVCTMAKKRASSRKPRSTSSDNTAKADAGGGQMEQTRAQLGLGAYAFGVGATSAAAAAVAAAKTGRLGRVVRVPSVAAKSEQRHLADLQKQFAGKDLKRVQGLKKGDRGEIVMQRYQGSFDDAVSPRTVIAMQRQAVSDAMKSSRGKLKYVKPKRK